MSIKPTAPPNIFMTAQRPIPSGGIAESSVTIPDGLTQEQRSLVNDIMALFRQYELDEFADPNRNTARNRLDRFIKILHGLSFQTVESILNDGAVIEKLSDEISRNVETTDFTKEDSKSNGIHPDDVRASVQKILDSKLKEGDSVLASIRGFLKDLDSSLKDDESNNNFKEIEKKILEQNDSSSKEQQEKEKPIVDKSKPKQTPPKVARPETFRNSKPKAPTQRKYKMAGAEAIETVKKLVNIQNKFFKGSTGSMFGKIAKATGGRFDFSKIIVNTRDNLQKIFDDNIKIATVPRLEKVRKDAISSVNAAIGGSWILKKLSGGGLKLMAGVGILGGTIIGAFLGGIWKGVAMIGKIIGGTIAALARGIVFCTSLIFKLGKLIVRGIGLAMAAPFKLAGFLLKKKSFWETLTAVLVTPVGMRALGFLVGRLILMIKKYGVLGTILRGYLALFKGISNLGKWVWGKIGPSIRKFWKKSKDKIKEKWKGFLDKHPRIKAINDFLVKVCDKVSGIAKDVSNWIDTKVAKVREWWDSKLKFVEDNYNAYVEKATLDGEQNIMTRNQFLANVIHQDMAAKFNIILEHINTAWQSILPIVNFVKGIVGFLQEHSWILTLLGILSGVMKQKTGNNPWSASIMAVMEGVLGYPGLIVGQIISYITEKVTLWAFNMFRRKQAKLKSSSEILKSMYGEDFDAAEKEKKTLGKLSSISASSFDSIDMVDSAGKKISGAEDKRKHLMGLFENFSKKMKEDMSRADEVVNVFSNLRLTSESGKNLDFANNLQEIFAKTGILQTHLLPFNYFRVHNFFGITPEKVYKTMDEAKGGETKNDGKTTSWRTAHLNYVNRLGMNLVRLKLNILGQIYGNIVRTMESAKEMGEENALWMLYSYLSPSGELYKNIQNTLLNSSKTDALLEKLTESWDFDNDGEADMMKKVGSLVDMSGFQTLDKAMVNQTKLTERSRIVEKVAGASRQISHISKQADKAMEEVSNRETVAGKVFQKTLAIGSAGAVPAMQKGAATITSAVMGKEEQAKANLLHYGGTDTGKINLGDISDVASGTTLDRELNSGNARKLKRYIDETAAGKTVITNPEFAEKFYNGFFTDLNAISLDFKHTSEALNVQIEKLRKMENITEADMIKAFTSAAGETKLSEQQLEYLAKSSYQLYQQDATQLDRMPEFFNGIFTGLQGFVQDRESFWNSKYHDLEPNQVLQEFVKDQMKKNNFTKDQEKFMEDYFQNHYKDANQFLKAAILSKTKLNESLKQQLGRKREELDRLAKKRAEKMMGQQ